MDSTSHKYSQLLTVYKLAFVPSTVIVPTNDFVVILFP